MSKNNIMKNKVSKYITISGRYRSEKPLFNKDVFANVFDWGGASQRAWDKAWSSDNAVGSLGQLAGGLGTIISAGINNAQTTDTTGIEGTIKDYRRAPIEMSSREGLLNQWTDNRGLKTNFERDDFTPSDWQRASNTFSSTLSGAMTGAQIGGPWGALAGGVMGLGSGLAGIFIGDAKAKEKAETLNNQAIAANSQRNRNFVNAADFLDQQDFMLNMQNYAALGGPIVNIFADGGSLSRTHGSDFTNGVTYINEGGTHEDNPNEGVQIGIDEQGNPNLVEEGEVVFNDYVYSNRLYAKGDDLAKYNLPDKYDGYTFARIANELFKESEESPNDHISLETLRVTADRLRGLQEEVRAEENKNNQNKFPWGGDMSFAEKNQYLRDLGFTEEEIQKFWIPDDSVPAGSTGRKYKFDDDAVLKALESYDKGTTSDGSISGSQMMSDPLGTLKMMSGEVPQGEVKANPSDFKVNVQQPEQKSDQKPKGETPVGNIPAHRDTIEAIKAQPISTSSPIGIARRPEKFLDPDIEAIKAHPVNEAPPIGISGIPDNYLNQQPLFPSSTPEARQELVDSGMFDEPESTFDWNGFGNQALRYTPVIGNLIGLFGNKKDYTDVNTFEEDTRNPRSVRFTPIGGHYDTNYVSPYEMQNPIIQGAANTRRMLANSSNGNSVAMRNALMASDLQTQGLIGQALLQGKEYNNTQRQRAAEFRRGIDQYNSTGAMQAQQANMGLNNYFYNRALNKYNMRNAIDMGYTQARGANATALFNNLGNIGRENVSWNMANENPALAWALMRDGNYRYKGV